MAVAEYEEDNSPKPRAWEEMLRRIPPKNMEVPRLRAVTPAYRRQALRRAGTGIARGAPFLAQKENREERSSPCGKHP